MIEKGIQTRILTFLVKNAAVTCVIRRPSPNLTAFTEKSALIFLSLIRNVRDIHYHVIY